MMPDTTQYTIELRGTPLGNVDLPPGQLTGGTVRPLSGYANVRTLVRDATLATCNLGFLGPVSDPRSTERANAAFEKHRTFLDALSLRDAAGAIVPCEFLDFTDGPDDDSPPAVFVSRK